MSAPENAIPQKLYDALKLEVVDPEEETFDLFSRPIVSQNLGFIDPKAFTLELSVAGRDLTIYQSPTVLSSNRTGGTTGAVVWKVTPALASWISNTSGLLWRHNVLTSSSAVLELGCGVSAIVGLVLAPKISRYVLTDQHYVAKSVQQNISENTIALHGESKARHPKGRRAGPGPTSASPSITFEPLDWELHDVGPSLTGSCSVSSFDALIACDCIYNEALVEPFVRTCKAVSLLRELDSEQGKLPTACVIAQQLRSPEVFEEWLKAFHRHFHVWRVPDSELPEDLRPEAGFVVHVGFIRR